MTQPTEQQGNQPEPAEQPVYQPAQHGPRNFLLQPRNSQRQFRDNRYRNSQWPCHHLRNRLCRSRNNRPTRINRNNRARSMLLPTLPESGNGTAEPTISRARAIRAFVGTADRITGY